MEETFHRVHAHNDSNCDGEEEVLANYDDDGVGSHDTCSNCLLQKDSRQLSVSQGQGPQTQVRGSVRNSAQNELDGLDDLVNCYLADVIVLGVPFWSGDGSWERGGGKIVLVVLVD